MKKTQEELNAIKEEVETMNKKLQELTEDELKQVVGGVIPPLAVQQVTLINTRTVSLIGLDGKPIGNPSSNPLDEVAKASLESGQSVIINK